MCLGVPGKIVAIGNDDSLMRSGKVSFGGAVKEINLSLVPEAKLGDYVIVHAGFAITVLDEKEAIQTFDYLAQIEKQTSFDGDDS